MSDKYNILIGITTRNAGKYIVRFLNTIDTYISLFKTYKVIFVDGHSTDTTIDLVNQWCLINPQCRKIISQFLNLTSDDKIFRAPSISEARNIVINQFRHLFNKETLLLVIDANSVNSVHFDINGFLTAFQPDFPEWVGIFPSQKHIYYDVFALRDIPLPRIDGHELCLKNYQIEIHETKDFSVENKYKIPHPYDLGFRHVFSAFGGAALYKTEYIDMNCKYDYYEVYTDKSNNSTINFATCEHVPFNLELAKKGSLFINTKWIVGEHD